MSKNEKLFNTTLRLNLNNAADREAYDNLISADESLPEYSSYSRTIVTALNDHFNRKDRMEDEREWEAELLEKVEDTVRATITQCLAGLQITKTAPMTKASTPPKQPDLPDETEVTILNFLDGF